MAKTSLNPLLPNAAISQKMIERLGKFKEYITNKDKKDTEPVRPNIPYQDRELKDIHNSYLKAIKYVRSQNIRNRDMPKDESDEFYFDKGNHKSAKYINGKYITKNAIESIKANANKYGLDPYMLASAVLIENNKGVKTSSPNNVHHLFDKRLEKQRLHPNIYYKKNTEGKYTTEIDTALMARDLGYMRADKTYSLPKVKDALGRKTERIIEAAGQVPDDGIEAMAMFIKENVYGAVNPKQTILPGVKATYTNMIDDGMTGLRTSYPDLFK